jgi:hypothetical protein
MVFLFALPPEEFAAALKRSLSQTPDGLRFKQGAQEVKFLYPPQSIVARGKIDRTGTGGTRIELYVVFEASLRTTLHTALGFLLAVVGLLRPDTIFGPVMPVVVGGLVFLSGLLMLWLAYGRRRDRVRQVLSIHALAPLGHSELGLDGEFGA